MNINNKYLNNLNILIVDDQVEIRETLQTLIGMWAKNAYSASDGKEGLESYKKYSPDIIVTDIKMPVMTGLEMIRNIKKEDPDFPIIITTAFQEPEYLLEAIELKVDGYIVKPIQKKELKKRLEIIGKSILLEQEIKKRLNAEKEYQDLYDYSAGMQLSVDAKTAKIIKCNQTVADNLGYSKEEIIGKSIFRFHHRDSIDDVHRTFNKFIATGEVKNAELIAKRKDGSKMYVIFNVTSVRDENNNILYSRSTWTDISERKKMEEVLAKQNIELKRAKVHLQYQAEHDALTDLPNRNLFLDRLSQSIKHAKRNNKKVAVLFLDLDRFKEVNDSLGHHVGDELLKIISIRLQKNIRHSDTVSRIGGDEFTMIIDQIGSMEEIIDTVQKVINSINELVQIEEHQIYVTFSIGIAVYPDDAKDSDSLLKNADAAMYKAKSEGRNNYQFYTSDMTKKALERITLEAELKEALINNELDVYYQMQMNIENNTLIGMEALSRWKHPKLGMIPPSKFIPLAERTGLILELDQWVMNQAITQWVKWIDSGLVPGKLSLNLSQIQLDSINFIEDISNLIKKHQIEPSLLMFEITESQIMNDIEHSIKQLHKLNELGIELAIDDFGTGYSSLSYLKQLPIDKLKIDQSFIRDIPDDLDDVEITKTIIAMANGLNLEVIAEGVETKEQNDFLLQNGCKEIQGYLYSKPSPAFEIEKLLIG